MRRGLIVAGWVAGTVAAVAVGVRAVNVVSSSVTENRPAALSEEMVADRLAEDTTTTATAGTSTSTTEATGATTTSGPAATTATTRPAPTTATTRATTTSTASRPAVTGPGAAEERTYQLVGGTVAVRFENGGARLLWATPKAGFRVEARHKGPPEVDVRFDSEEHESRLRAWWDNGPQADIREEPDD